MKLTEQEERARSMVCLPLDGLATLNEVIERVEELSPVVGLFKVGKESYTRFGPAVVKMVQEYGANVFLDLKYHDIPNTVRGAADAATQLGVYMFNVHASGGSAMLEAAVEGANNGADKYGVERPKVIGVTVLTSLNDKDLYKIGVGGNVDEQVHRLLRLSEESGLDGVVCSAQDVGSAKLNVDNPDYFLFVTPGVKGPNTPAGEDQKRVATPGNAVQDGSSILVIGRAITGPKTPELRLEAGYAVLQDMAPHL